MSRSEKLIDASIVVLRCLVLICIALAAGAMIFVYRDQPGFEWFDLAAICLLAATCLYLSIFAPNTASYLFLASFPLLLIAAFITGLISLGQGTWLVFIPSLLIMRTVYCLIECDEFTDLLLKKKNKSGT